VKFINVKIVGWFGQYESYSDFEKLTYWAEGVHYPVYMVQPFLPGTLEYVNHDASILLEHTVTNESVDAILAKREFDKDLEKLLDE
jgi:hypothetical protein